MAATSYAPANTRPMWAGADADRDIHIEAYEGDIEGSFRVESMFRSSGLTTFKSVADRTNTWRGDRMGGVVVKSRKSGEGLDGQRIPTDKMTITVDTLCYVRTHLDYTDDWTAPDFQAETSQEHGIAHAKAFDQAHVIQLIKAGYWKAPEHLKQGNAFRDGIVEEVTGYAAETDPEVKADLLVRKHKDILAEFVKRDLGGSLSEFITLMKPDDFNVLLDHKKLMNVEFQGGQGENSFSHRRVATLNGIRVVETPRFPDDAITDHILGPQFNVTAGEAKAIAVVYMPRKALVTVEAKPLTVRQWDDPKEFSEVLDSYCMYNIGVRRGDVVAVINTD